MVVLNRVTLTFENNVPKLRENAVEKEESLAAVPSTKTHLHLESQGITEIGELSPYPRLRVLYLFDNKIKKIANLDFSPNLTHLYLQNNRIFTIENLHCLPHLQKLFLSGNYITVVEGLETNSQLNELHVDHQKLADGESLVLDPRSASMLQRCLLTLDISGNNIRDLGNFQHLRNLTGLFLSDNQLANINLFLTVLEKLADLRYLRVSGNPLSKTMRYREKIIMATSCLEILDGKTVSAQNKQFLSSMLHSRHPFPPCEVPSGMRSSDMNARSFNGMDGLLLPNVVSGTKVTDRIRTVADGDGPVRCAMPARSAPKLRKIPSAMLAQQEQILRKLQLRM
ncbi:protein phosphatase 1 regulatory subunit 42-like isoform X1 [Paramacrobiotus metropolitanus]|uniref:protein phosphatase 1 regulatory subunit 42-like isoform X1 n=1 Tax=Paramacrobiotus metropolitanus TaxID=2943436 RepID=UPI002445886E|nr:protein phosphatase 1 regulatory subunit 42-like isoform X1 [Paramacrobiotus metropolitanus]